MALALDASSVSGTYNQAAGASFTCTSASFSPPANSWIYFQVGYNTTNTGTLTQNTPTNTGTALTWTLVANRLVTTGGGVSVYRAFNLNAQVGITCTQTGTIAGAAFAAKAPSSGYAVDVWTGTATSQTGAAATGASSTNQTNNIALVMTQPNSVEAMFGEDWGQKGTPTTTSPNGESMGTTWNIAGETSGGRSRRATVSAGSNSINWVAGGAAPTLNYVVYEIISAAGDTFFGQAVM